MRAFSLTGHDTFDTLQAAEAADPRPGAGEVTIAVEYAGIGLIDAFRVSGFIPADIGYVPGLEVSGTVLGIGDGVEAAEGLEPGVRVAAILPAAGGFAEIARTPASLVAPIPDGVAADLAAVIPINTVTAHLALTTVARFVAGESLLVHAGVGGLGSQFGQVARALGAGRIDAVVGSPEKAEVARALGYDDVYLRSDLAAIALDSYDIVVDPVGGEATTVGFRALRGGGRLVRVGNASQAPDVALSSMAHWFENKTTAGFNVGAWLGAHPSQGTVSLRWALAAVARGEVRVELTRVEGSDRLGALLAELEAGETTGKLAIRM